MLAAMAAEPMCYTGGMVATNAYLVDTPDGVICFDAPEGLDRWLHHEGKKVAALVLTHAHFDHMWDAGVIEEHHGCPVYVHPLEAAWVREPGANVLFGIEAALQPVKEPRLIEVPERGEASLEVAGKAYRIAHIPGHSPGSVTFYDEEAGQVFGGDTLFAGGIGRTDLPGGSFADLTAGIRQHLLPLPAETRLYPGHGPSTTIGEEDAGNPFLREGAVDF